LARLGRLLADPEVVDSLRESADARAVRQVLLDAESRLG
jgi:hypothetical protein